MGEKTDDNAGRVRAGDSARAAANRPAAGSADLLGLQRSAGNRAVNSLVGSMPSSPPVDQIIRRMTVEEVRGELEYSFAEEHVEDEVVAHIAAVTTEWEDKGSNPTDRYIRKRWISARVGGLFNDTDVALDPPEQGDLAYWRPKIAALITAGEAELPTTPTVVKPETLDRIAANNESEELVVDRRVDVEVTMGQGITADLGRFVLFSDQFSSCTAVAIVNAGTRRGGLFHYGAGIRSQHESLTRMVDEVNPTWIGIENRAGSEVDNLALTQLFGEIAAAAELAVLHSGNAQWLYLDEEGIPEASSQEPFDRRSGGRVNATVLDELPESLEDSGLSLHIDEGTYADAGGFKKMK